MPLVFLEVFFSLCKGELRRESACLEEQNSVSAHRGDDVHPVLLQLAQARADGVQGKNVTTSFAGPDLGIPCIGDVATVSGVAGGTFCLPAHIKRPATESVKQGQVWELATHQYLEQQLLQAPEPGDVITMGLFFGDFLPHFSRLAGDQHRVWGFEPNPDNFAHARGTIALNQLHNCWIANTAVGKASEGTLDFCIGKSGESLGGWSHVKAEGEECVVGQIPVISLDSILPPERRITFIHLDVEGQETNVLLGANATIQKWRPLIVVETFNRPAPDLVVLMTQLGYSKAVGDVDDNSAFFSSLQADKVRVVNFYTPTQQ